jgi:hypothetical protein
MSKHCYSALTSQLHQIVRQIGRAAKRHREAAQIQQKCNKPVTEFV